MVVDKVKLRNKIRESFNDDEFRSLCFELEDYNVKYDNLNGEKLDSKIEALIGFFDRRHALYELVDYCKKSRSNVDWSIFQQAFKDLNKNSTLEFYPAGEIGFVVSNTGYVSKLQLRGSLVNITPDICSLALLEIHLLKPEGELLKFPWKLFYSYLPSGKKVEKRIDTHPITVRAFDYVEP